MKINSLNDIEILKESTEIECKLALGKDGLGNLPNDIWETYSSFANTDGGVILLGIKEHQNNYELVGIKNPEKVISQLFNILNNPQKVSKNLLDHHSFQINTIDHKSIIEIAVPKARRQDKPIYIGSNPFTGSYKRTLDGDYKLTEEEIKTLISEQYDIVDDRLLEGYGIDDLDLETVEAFRNNFIKSDHPFLSSNIEQFLENINAIKVDRKTKHKCVTMAGLLMFGKLNSILDEFPCYTLDYQEHSSDKSRRWDDRITTDGTWAGNLYQFYKKIYKKLTEDLKIPFKLDNGIRVDETPVHKALRESLVNALIHADYKSRTSILIIKSPGEFLFRNPGYMRVPIKQAIDGGTSDCRNRLVQKMFQFIGASEQAGSGVPQIFQAWKTQNWQPPLLKEDKESYTVSLELRTTHLFSEDTFVTLSDLYGAEKFQTTTELERRILGTIYLEKSTNHARIMEISSEHSADISKTFKKLVINNFLNSQGDGRGTTYTLLNNKIPAHDKHTYNTEFDKRLDNKIALELQLYQKNNSEGFSQSSEGLSQSSEGLSQSSEGLSQSSEGFSQSSEDLINQNEGNLMNTIFDNIDMEPDWVELRQKAEDISKNVGRKNSREFMEKTIIEMCTLMPQRLEDLSQLLDKNPDYLRQNFIKPMIKSKKLKPFYRQETHPKQAYVANTQDDI